CGVYGHKPSETALPRSGQFPYPPMPNAAVAMGVQGPLARSAEDLELALDVLAGPDTGEDTAWRLELPAARHTRLAEFRIAVLPPIDWLSVDGEITTSLDRLAAGLASAGATVKRAQPEILGDLRRHPCLLPRVGRAPRADHARARVSPRSEALPARRQVAARHPRGRRPQRPLRSAACLPRCRDARRPARHRVPGGAHARRAADRAP